MPCPNEPMQGERIWREAKKGQNPAAPESSEEESARQGIKEAPRKALLCRTCRQPVSSPEAAFCMRSPHTVQLFVNPAGFAREVLTLKEAHNLHFEGWSTLEATWFAGYAWRIAYCGRCGTHLGWRFERRLAQDGPPEFFGLLCEELTSDDPPS